MLTRAIHFVGFRGDEYSSAIRIWGVPDFFHMIVYGLVVCDLCKWV